MQSRSRHQRWKHERNERQPRLKPPDFYKPPSPAAPSGTAEDRRQTAAVRPKAAVSTSEDNQQLQYSAETVQYQRKRCRP
jgi:hypothetical protein